MGKVLKEATCLMCGKKGEALEIWGKAYCRECYAKKPKKAGGHSGMLKDKNIKGKLQQRSLMQEDGLWLQPTNKGDKIFATLFLEHYPQSKGIMGRSLEYIIWNNGEIIGIIGASSPPLNYKKFRKFFQVDNENNYLNNNVFRIIKSGKNQATKILKIFRYTIKRDYKERYNHYLMGLVTFVEPPRDGAIYRADNWTYLGMTEGKKVTRRGSLSEWVNKKWSETTQKHIFARRI